MDTKELKKKICKEYGVQPMAVCVYQNEHGTFVQMYNARTKKMKAVSEKDVEEINKMIDGGEAVFKAFSIHFQKNLKILELATDYILGGGNMLSLDGIVNYVNKSSSKQHENKSADEDDLTILKPHGKIEGYKVEDEELVGPLFGATIEVEKMGYKNNQTRCFVDEIETDSQSRGNGFATKMLTSFLPSLCSLSYISSIVLQAGAFDVENEKQTQNSLEKFYKNCGFFEVENVDDFNCVKQSDFDQGYSVFVKNVDLDRIFE
ncbi:MAG: hypothetical protein ACI4T2_00255 [Christensenellales bacterium]